jgi:hypothetical protein
MWNPEARDSSPIIFYIYEFMGFQSKMPPPRGRRGTRSNGAGKSTAVEDFARFSVEYAQDAAAAGKEGDKGRRRRKGGEQAVAV